MSYGLPYWVWTHPCAGLSTNDACAVPLVQAIVDEAPRPSTRSVTRPMPVHEATEPFPYTSRPLVSVPKRHIETRGCTYQRYTSDSCPTTASTMGRSVLPMSVQLQPVTA